MPVGTGTRRPQGRSRRAVAGPLRPTIRIARVAGIEIGANWTWLIVVVLIVWSLAAEVFPTQNPGLGTGTYVAMSVAAMLMFFTSLLLHELGHAIRARREGMEIEGITLWVFGGVAWFRGMFPSAGAEFRIAIAGPAVTLVIAAVLIPLAAAVSFPPAIDGVVTWVGNINLVLLVFNMLPALPLDGGRVLRSVLWKATADFVRATRIAGTLGTGLGQVMVFGGVFLLLVFGAAGGLWIAVIGWFLMGAASAETAFAVVREAVRGVRVASAMTPDPEVVAADDSVREFMSRLLEGPRHAAYPVVDGTLPIGLLSFRQAARVPTAEWARVRAKEIASPLSECIVLDTDTPLEDSLPELGASADERAIVVRDGALAGIVSSTDLARLVELCRRVPAVALLSGPQRSAPDTGSKGDHDHG